MRRYGTKDRRYVVDVSELLDGQQFVEISRKVARADSSRLREQFAADLRQSGVPVCTELSAQAVNKLHALR